MVKILALTPWVLSNVSGTETSAVVMWYGNCCTTGAVFNGGGTV